MWYIVLHMLHAYGADYFVMEMVIGRLQHYGHMIASLVHYDCMSKIAEGLCVVTL